MRTTGNVRYVQERESGMSATRQPALDRPHPPIPPPFDRQKAIEQLARILHSPHFRNSRRCQALLKYVVESLCEGRVDDLKERVVGSNVFGRDPDYDTNQDAVVRNAAAEVRKRLAQYYLEHHAEDTLRIDLPTGSYLPELHPLSPPEPKSPPPGRSRLPFAFAAALLLLAASALLLWRGGWLLRTELDQFWAPLVSTPHVIQICVGQSGLYYYPEPPPRNPAGELDAKAKLPASSLKPLRDRFLYFGDSICLAKINGYLQTAHKEFRFRGASSTSYAELRGLPVVLIGAFNNSWNLRLTRDLRFSLDKTTADFHVADRQNPGAHIYSVSRSGPTDWDVDADYALVTRVFDKHTENWVVAAGGFTSSGTMAAGDFLSNPAYLHEAIQSAPPGWERKNMQFVLQTIIVGGTPGPPKVMATHFW